jgi:hypothetical protein
VRLLTIRKFVLGLLLAVAAISAACTEPQARPERLTGEETHERHSTGIESQAKDM